MLAQLQSFAVVALLAVASYGLGSALLRGLRIYVPSRLDRLVFGMTLGWIAAGTILAALGLVGPFHVPLIGLVSLLNVPLIGVLTLTGAFWTIGTFLASQDSGPVDEASDLHDGGGAVQSSGLAAPRWLLGFAALAAIVASLGALMGAAAPTTAGDALCYHLELPKTFLAEHRLAFDPYSENATFPLLTEMWYLWGLALDGPVAASLIHWFIGLLFAGATVVLATPIVGRGWGWIAGCVALLVPGVTNQMTAPMNDLALALTTTVALAAWWRAVMLEEGRRWLIVAGIAAGGAMAIKYLALLFALAMAAGSLWAARNKGPKRQLVLEAAAVITVVAVSTAGLWYVRAAWHRGNPVYPFLTEVFSPDTPVYADAHETLPESKSQLGRTPWGAVAAAWHVTMRPERVGGRSHQPGVLFLAFLPGLLLTRRLRGLGTLVIIGTAYWIVWYLLRQNVRFLLPLIPIGAVAVVWVLAEMGRFPAKARWAGTGLACGVLAVYMLVAAERCRDQWAVATGLESRNSYLARNEPTWEAATVWNPSFLAKDHLLSLDHRAFYFKCPVTREKAYRRHTGYHVKLASPDQLAPLLRKAGFTHLLLARNLNSQGVQFDPTLPRLVENSRAVLGRLSFPVLWDYTFDDADGGRRHYQLVLVD